MDRVFELLGKSGIRAEEVGEHFLRAFSIEEILQDRGVARPAAEAVDEGKCGSLIRGKKLLDPARLFRKKLKAQRTVAIPCPVWEDRASETHHREWVLRHFAFIQRRRVSCVND